MAKNDEKQYERNLEGLREIMWDTVALLKDGKIDKDRAAVMIKGGETIVKTYVAEVAHQHMIWEKEKRSGRILQLGQDGGEEAAKPGEEKGKSQEVDAEVAVDSQGGEAAGEAEPVRQDLSTETH